MAKPLKIGLELTGEDVLPTVLPSASVLPAEAQPSAGVVFVGNCLTYFTVAGSTTAPPAGFTAI